MLNGMRLSGLLPDAQTDHPARPQTTTRPRAYPSRYVEDLVEARTQPVDRFNIRLRFLERLKGRHLHIEYAPTFPAT